MRASPVLSPTPTRRSSSANGRQAVVPLTASGSASNLVGAATPPEPLAGPIKSAFASVSQLPPEEEEGAAAASHSAAQHEGAPRSASPVQPTMTLWEEHCEVIRDAWPVRAWELQRAQGALPSCLASPRPSASCRPARPVRAQVLVSFMTSVTIMYTVFPFFTYVPSSGLFPDELPKARVRRPRARAHIRLELTP